MESHRGGVEYLAERRAKLAEKVLPLYRRGMGHKSIAKEIGCSPRIARTILIESGEYKPGSLLLSDGHRQRLSDANRNRVLTHEAKAAMREAIRNSAGAHALHAWLTERGDARKSERDYERLYWVEFKALRVRTNKWASWMDKYRRDPQLRAAHLSRKRVRNMVQRGTASPETLELIGCSRELFMAHIQRQFAPGMHWDNLGIGEGFWNLDHIKPISDWDLTDYEQRKQCFSWRNTQPLWSLDNIRKSNKPMDQWRASKVAQLLHSP